MLVCAILILVASQADNRVTWLRWDTAHGSEHVNYGFVLPRGLYPHTNYTWSCGCIYMRTDYLKGNKEGVIVLSQHHWGVEETKWKERVFEAMPVAIHKIIQMCYSTRFEKFEIMNEWIKDLTTDKYCICSLLQRNLRNLVWIHHDVCDILRVEPGSIVELTIQLNPHTSIRYCWHLPAFSDAFWRISSRQGQHNAANSLYYHIRPYVISICVNGNDYIRNAYEKRRIHLNMLDYLNWAMEVIVLKLAGERVPVEIDSTRIPIQRPSEWVVAHLLDSRISSSLLTALAFSSRMGVRGTDLAGVHSVSYLS